MSDTAIIIAESEAALDAKAASANLAVICKQSFDTLSTYLTPAMAGAGDVDVGRALGDAGEDRGERPTLIEGFGFVCHSAITSSVSFREFISLMHKSTNSVCRLSYSADHRANNSSSVRPLSVILNSAVGRSVISDDLSL